MDVARNIIAREERTLWVGDDSRAADPADGAIIVARGGDVVAAPDALPFADGLFDHVVCRSEASALAGERGERRLRELERVTAPSGTYRLLAAGEIALPERTRIGQILREVGLEAEVAESGDVVATGRRESGVDRETFRKLDGGEAATKWNDEMFEFQRTPYDPMTIAGQIFLRRVRWAAARVPKAKGTRVLEIGCEAGGLLRHLPETATVIGLDLSLSALRTAGRELAGRPVSLVHADATKPLPFRDGEFDVVLASEMLEHCVGPRRVIGEMHRILKPDGRAILTVPNERHYLAWKQWLARFPLTRWMLRGIEEGPAAWHIHHDFDRGKLLWLIEGFFTVESSSTIFGTTLALVLKRV